MRFIDLYPNQGYFFPGSLIKLTAEIKSNILAKGVFSLETYFLNKLLFREAFCINLTGGVQSIEVEFKVPSFSPRGYGVEAELLDETGVVVSSISTAFDVLDCWVQFPRYGFITDFQEDRVDPEKTIDSLVRYHVNGLQYYDWQYRHDKLVSPTDDFTDPLNRRLSLSVIKNLITVSNKSNIAAMPYLAVYAASIEFWQEHQHWGLYDKNDKPIMFEDFLGLMDPTLGSPWMDHLLVECENVLKSLPFDGLHLDQYGEPKEGFNAQGKAVDIPQAFKDFIQKLKNLYPREVVVFNAVGNWPIEELATSPQDFVYIEIWPPTPYFRDLHEIVSFARKKSDGKPVVIALYLPSNQINNIVLADALIFASGGSRIEVGEMNCLLTDPYFPKHEKISQKLETILRRYYDFAIRYENLIGPEIVEVNKKTQTLHDGVISILRESTDYLTINLLNFVDLPEAKWTETQEKPKRLDNISVKIENYRVIKNVFYASPDNENIGLTECVWKQNKKNIDIDIPNLEYWTMIVIEYETLEK
jgi:dextranase